MKSVWKDNQRVWGKREERERKRRGKQTERSFRKIENEAEREVRWVGKMECRSEGGDS